ncbi:MAG: SIMPL domain-containing protein [Scrofimicrobium sp.]
MTTIQATGTGIASIPAELATITANIDARSSDRSTSVANATTLHNEVVDTAKKLIESGDAIWHSASPIRTMAQKTYVNGQPDQVAIEYVTTSYVKIKLSNLELVSELATKLAEAGVDASVGWSLTDETKRSTESDVRKQAVVEAGQVAADYAEALGEQIGVVLSITDVSSGVQPVGPGSGVMRSLAVSAPAEVTIEDITVTSQVIGTYETIQA